MFMQVRLWQRGAFLRLPADGPAHSGFLSNFHVSRLCSNSVRTRAARAMGPISLGLAVTFWSVFHRWERSAKPLSPRHLAELSSIFLVRVLMSSSLTPFGFFTGVRMP